MRPPKNEIRCEIRSGGHNGTLDGVWLEGTRMDLGVTMSSEVFEDKLEHARDGKHTEATWNTRRLPKRMTPGWTNRLFVAVDGRWRGYFPLSGEVLWNPEDEVAPYALIINTLGWTSVEPVPVRNFRSWRYLSKPPSALRAAEKSPREVDPQLKADR